MLPNHYEVEEVSRIRREEAVHQARHDRLGRDLKRKDDGRLLKAERSTNVFGWLGHRLSAWLKRKERMPARSLTDYQ